MKQRLLILIIILIALSVVLVYALSRERPEVAMPDQELATTSDPAEIGEVGEITIENEQTGGQEPLVGPGLPKVISSTVGTILEVKSDSIIVQGVGTNFADGLARQLTRIFTVRTLTIGENKVKYIGMAGLDVLQQGMEILIDGAENIRGKTNFNVKALRTIE